MIGHVIQAPFTFYLAAFKARERHQKSWFLGPATSYAEWVCSNILRSFLMQQMFGHCSLKRVQFGLTSEEDFCIRYVYLIPMWREKSSGTWYPISPSHATSSIHLLLLYVRICSVGIDLDLPANQPHRCLDCHCPGWRCDYFFRPCLAGCRLFRHCIDPAVVLSNWPCCGAIWPVCRLVWRCGDMFRWVLLRLR